MIQTRSVVLIFLLFLISKIHGQNDTIIVKKDPVVIHQDVYYSNAFDPHHSKNHISLDYFVSSKTANVIQDDVFNQLEISEVKAQKNITLNYERKVKNLGFGFGLGLKKTNQNINQTAFSKISFDSTSLIENDTLDSFFSTRDGITTELFIIEPKEVWEKEEVVTEKSSMSSTSNYYLRIPISVSYTGFVKRWSFSFKTQLVSNFLILKNEEVIFYDLEHEKQELTDEYARSYFAELSPEVEVGYNLDVGIGLFVGYRQNYLLSDVTNVKSLNKRSRGSLGVGAKYYF